MNLYLQFGHGMMELCDDLISAGVSKTVILSPRDLAPSQIGRFGERVLRAGGENLLDPQFYLPHEEYAKLQRHSYWPAQYATNTFWATPQVASLTSHLWGMNQQLGTRAFILPGLFAPQIAEQWKVSQLSAIQAARLIVGRFPLIATVALGADAVSNNAQVEELLEFVTAQDIDGIYLVAQKPNDQYFSSNPNWLSNILDVVAGVRLSGKSVIVGYANQELLFVACSGANAIASGTWMNVRSFSPSKFRVADPDEMRMRATWFYHPQSLSEFKIPTLDIAQKQGLLPQLRPTGPYRNDYGEQLFFGGQPTTSGFGEHAAFRHFLHCLGAQCHAAARASFDESCEASQALLHQAEEMLAKYKRAGVHDPARGFSDQVSAVRGALAAHQVARGAVLRRKWDSLLSGQSL